MGRGGRGVAAAPPGWIKSEYLFVNYKIISERGVLSEVICITTTSKLDESVQIVGQIVVSFQGICPGPHWGAYSAPDPTGLYVLQISLARPLHHMSIGGYERLHTGCANRENIVRR